MATRAEVRHQVLTCTRCPLHDLADGPVPFRGPDRPALLVIGEAPGRWENRARRPFVGPAGSKLGLLLARAGWDVTREVAFVNAVSCWPNRPDNQPKWSEVDACHTNLIAQMEYLRPERLLIVGLVAAGVWWPNVTMKEIRGRWFEAEGVPALATYHPAAVLRDQTLEHATFLDIEKNHLGPTLTSTRDEDYECVRCGKEAEVWVSDGRDVTLKAGHVGLPWCYRCLNGYRRRMRKDGDGAVQLALEV